MDKKDLRIGNLFNYEQTTHIVTGIVGDKVYSRWLKQPDTEPDYICHISECKPIDINETDLLIFGFTGPDQFNWYHKEYTAFEGDDWLEHTVSVAININSLNVGIWNKSQDEIGSSTKIQKKYIHNLQNLWYELTGEDL